MASRPRNPFVFGEIIDQRHGFVDREEELARLVRDLADGQKVFLLSPRRFGKSSLVAVAFGKLEKQYVRCVNIPISNYASYAQFLEKFTERVIRAAGPLEQVKQWAARFLRSVRADLVLKAEGEFSVSIGQGVAFDPHPVAAEVFALPGELAKKSGSELRMAICLDEFQAIEAFDSGAVESALRNEVQRQREIGYVFAGSQPSVMEKMIQPKRPFYKSGPPMFLDKIPAPAWRSHIQRQFDGWDRPLNEEALHRLLALADLIPFDVQRLAHELWDYAMLGGKGTLGAADVNAVAGRLVDGASPGYERQWLQLTVPQRGVLQAMALGETQLHGQEVRKRRRLGAASTVQKALASLAKRDLVDLYHQRHFLLDPLFAEWIRRKAR